MAKRFLKLFFVVAIFQGNVTQVTGRKIFHVNKWQNCKEFPNLPIVLTSHKQHNYGVNNRTTEQTYIVKKKISGKISGKSVLIKCNSSGAPDTCEFFVKDLKYSGVCDKINEKRQAWTPFVESFTPKLECPIEAGTYHSEVFITDDSYKFFPVPAGIWKARWILFNENKMIFCQDFEWRVVDVRRS